jgi:hypothetical protein
MKMKTIRFTLSGAALVAAFILSAAAQDARHLTVLHTFSGGKGTGDPGGLVQDAAGNFYGTTFWGGNFHGCGGSGCGVAYRLSPQGSGWAYTVLYEFSGDQGAEPSQLTLDAAGNLYGEFSAGGPDDVGGVFELSPTTSGPWKFTTLYSFSIEANGEAPNGEIPVGGLLFDSAGNLYGATAYGGTVDGGLGTVFELSPNGSGGWNESVIWSVSQTFTHPNGIVFDSAGNLYGASAGGNGPVGGVFELKPNGSGGWTSVSLYTFTNGSSDGYTPQGAITLDSAGNVYGSTIQGGGAPPHDYGTIYQLSPNSSGGYTFNLLYTFVGGNAGALDYNGVIPDSSGNLFGAALDGADNWGVVFELSPSSSGWTYGLVHTFTGGPDGGYPDLALDAGGNLYGTAPYGAKPGCENDSGCGVVFKLSAPAPAGHR